MRIYTKSGDKGETGLLGGLRVPKHSRRIATIGAIDELNASLGVLLTQCEDSRASSPAVSRPRIILTQVQHDLFDIGAELADPENKYSASSSVATTRISNKNIKFIEQNIDALELELPRLKNFILPCGTPFTATAHLSRAICRRAERSVVRLTSGRHIKEPIRPAILIYLNRLSDLLFMLAREDMFNKKEKEQTWPAHKI